MMFVLSRDPASGPPMGDRARDFDMKRD